MAWQTKQAAGTPHSATCTAAFGRKDPTCPRCQELLAGAPARAGWGSERRQRELRVLQDIRAHDCTKSKCGPVCTAFDY